MRNDLLEERLISDIFGVIPNLCQGRPGGDLEWSCRWLEEVEIYIGPQIPLIFGVWPAKQKKKSSAQSKCTVTVKSLLISRDRRAALSSYAYESNGSSTSNRSLGYRYKVVKMARCQCFSLPNTRLLIDSLVIDQLTDRTTSKKPHWLFLTQHILFNGISLSKIIRHVARSKTQNYAN